MALASCYPFPWSLDFQLSVKCGKYGKTSRNVFNQKIDYALAEVSTRYEIATVNSA